MRLPTYREFSAISQHVLLPLFLLTLIASFTVEGLVILLAAIGAVGFISFCVGEAARALQQE